MMYDEREFIEKQRMEASDDHEAFPIKPSSLPRLRCNPGTPGNSNGLGQKVRLLGFWNSTLSAAVLSSVAN